MNTITNKTFDEERALYDSHDIAVQDCAFDGPADGESADIKMYRCDIVSSEFGWSVRGITMRIAQYRANIL